MKSKTIKKIEALMLQLESLCLTHQHELMANDVMLEFEAMINTKNVVDSQRLLSLMHVLHGTRGLDTSLRLFLEIHNHVPVESKNHHLKGYIRQLQNPKGKFLPLDGNIAKDANEFIVTNRNKYMHVSNTYPTEGESGVLISKILYLLNIVLTL